MEGRNNKHVCIAQLLCRCCFWVLDGMRPGFEPACIRSIVASAKNIDRSKTGLRHKTPPQRNGRRTRSRSSAETFPLRDLSISNRRDESFQRARASLTLDRGEDAARRRAFFQSFIHGRRIVRSVAEIDSASRICELARRATVISQSPELGRRITSLIAQLP